MDYSQFCFHNGNPAGEDLDAALILQRAAVHGIELSASMRATLTSAATRQAGIREHLETCYHLS